MPALLKLQVSVLEGVSGLTKAIPKASGTFKRKNGL
jgi:hypothetical protein